MSAAGRPIRVVIISPALSVRLGLRAMLTGETEIEIIGEAALPADAGRLLLQAQVCLLAGRAISTARLVITDTGPAVLLLLDEPPRQMAGISGAAVWGMLPLDSSSAEIAAAVKALAAGLFVADPAWLSASAHPFFGPDDLNLALEDLTRRETEVLQQLALGLANKQIAAVLGLSENTVKFHVSAIYAKLGASNRAEAVRLGARQGLISL